MSAPAAAMPALRAFVTAWVCAAFAVFAVPDASAQRAGPVQASGERVSEDAAVAFLGSFFAGRPSAPYSTCGDRVWQNSPITAYEISSTRLRITICNGQSVHELAFVDYPYVSRRQREVIVCSDANADYDLLYNGCHDVWIFSLPADVQAFANAWLALAHLPPRDPATDAAFQAALQAARASGVDRTEEDRRAQVQVEALLQANHADEAAARYREALAASPDWANGHYNLALIAGDLGKHAEAITEMRRYLYLVPNAPDARAARDQIYRWEALAPADGH